MRELPGAGRELDAALDLPGPCARFHRLREHACRLHGRKLGDRGRSSREPLDRLARSVALELAQRDHVLGTCGFDEVVRLVLRLAGKRCRDPKFARDLGRLRRRQKPSRTSGAIRRQPRRPLERRRRGRQSLRALDEGVSHRHVGADGSKRQVPGALVPSAQVARQRRGERRMGASAFGRYRVAVCERPYEWMAELEPLSLDADEATALTRLDRACGDPERRPGLSEDSKLA